MTAIPIRLIVFVVVSAGMIWMSRSCFRDFRSHGFFRFFAWESILALILINIEYWFRDPFSLPQIISWLLLTICTYLVVHGIVLLVKLGKLDSQREDPTLIGLEKTTELVTVGIYRYIRHPIYGALMFLAWGVFLKNPTLAMLYLPGVATFFLIMTAKMEEAENMRFFGSAYEAYMKRSKMFIPFLY